VTDRFVDCYTPGLKDTEYLLTIGMTADPYFRLKTPDSDNFMVDAAELKSQPAQ
jgi:hypothetical protein